MEYNSLDFETGNIVTIPIEVPPYTFRYAILCDRTAEEILEFARQHERVFVFPFATKSVDEVNDYSGLCSEYVVQPIYIGNLKPLRKAVSEVMRVALETSWGLKPDTAECILDESLLLPE